MTPVHPRIADGYFVIGERYTLEVIEERSAKTHAHYFACLHDIWMNLPEGDAERFPTEDHMRKYALIKSGYADERSIVCSSRREAIRIAAFVQTMDSFAVVIVRGAVVRVFTAQSQSKRSMGKEQFQESKQAVLDYCSGLLGISSAEAEKNAGGAA